VKLGRAAPMGASETAPRCPVLGSDCFCGEPEDAAALLLARATSGAGGYGCFCNVHVIVSALDDRRLRHSLDEAWMLFPDGAPVAWMQRRSGTRQASRIAGPDLMPRLIELGRPLGLRHYLLGSTDEVLGRLRQRIERDFSAIVAGSASPTIADPHAEASGLVETIRASEPDVVWCALGAPKQELWMQANAPRLAPALLLGVGAAFDFLAGTKPRAPAFLQDHGLEWLHRLASEPRRLTGRYLRTNTEFVVRAALELARSPLR
jgi:N-acetylglucosaminyldiphosphoundecaprenol N-acetyl-beta-D-mannosaminyltransferase